MESWAPLDSQEEWDKSGNQILFHNKEIKKVLVALDVTDCVVKKAIEEGFDLILTHHPFLFGGISYFDDEDPKGKLILPLLENKISVYSAHTNLDKAEDGVNDQWIQLLNLENVEMLSDEEEIGIVGEGNYTTKALYEKIKSLEIPRIVCHGKPKEEIHRIAVLGGSGADYVLDAVKKGADVLLTGDVTHHKAQDAYEAGIMVFDIGHYDSEKFVLSKAKEKLEKEFSTLIVEVYGKNDFIFSIEE